MKFTVPWPLLHLVALLFTFQTADQEDKPPKPKRNIEAAASDQAQEADAALKSLKERDAAQSENNSSSEGGKSLVEKVEQKDRDEESEAASIDSWLPADDQEAIEKFVKDVESRFNEHDAKAFAALFAEDAEIVNVEGLRIHGRDAIQEIFQEFFEESPDSKLAIEIRSLRPLSSTLILEQGTSRVMKEEDGPTESSNYVVIYSKSDDGWLMVYARDSAGEVEHGARVAQLEWLIGDWVDESSDAVVATTYRWAESRRFIEGQFYLRASGYDAVDGAMRIGWDAQAKQLRSWVFHSDGGFATGLWSETDDGWMIKLTGVTCDGDQMSATNYLNRIGDDQLSYRSVDRTISGEGLPDGEEVLIVRHPPVPESLGQK